MKNDLGCVDRNRRVVRVTREEYELDDGSVHVIEPPLDHDETPEEFQQHYDRALEAMRCLQGTRYQHGNTQAVGQEGKDQDHQD
jgi:hypothetical protein